MLVLSRKVGEQIVIDDNITVVVTRIEGNRVSIGIKAPSDIKIVRGELDRFEADAKFSGDEQITRPVSPITFPSDSSTFVPRLAR